jgi:CHASE1-domain containing sensor protein
VPLVVLAVAVAFSVGVALHFQAAAHDRTEREFETAVGESTGAVRSEVARSEDALRGVRGLFGAGADVRRAEFRAYVTSLALSERFPSMLGITYVSSVPAADLERFEARQRRDGAPRFAISLAPESDRRLQALDRRRIVAFEETTGLAPPLTLGYDVTARTGARAAQDHSRDTGRATLTAKLNVIPGPAPGFSLLMPVYRTGAPARTVAERRAALRGWAIARFRGPDFLANVPRAMAAKIGVELFDGDRADARNLLGATRAASHDGAMTRTRRIDAAGRTWTLRHTALPGFATAHRERAPLIALLGGLFLSLLTVALIRTRMAARLRADREVEAHSREVAAFAVMQHEFVATASHELRTPLTSIIGYLELVLDAPPGKSASSSAAICRSSTAAVSACSPSSATS